MKDDKIVLITRSFNRRKIKSFIEEIYTELDRIIVLVNLEKEHDYYTQTLLSTCDSIIFDKIDIVHIKPWGEASGALNIGLMKAYSNKEKPTYILIASPEVLLKKKHIDKMSRKLSSDRQNLLVVGYALEAFGKGHVKTKGESNALKVPWNTCAMWNAELFLKNVGAFNVISDCSDYLGDKLQGMEDALAIALAKRNNPSLKIKLLWEDRPTWDVDVSEKGKLLEKMDRKSKVYKRYEEKFEKIEKLNF